AWPPAGPARAPPLADRPRASRCLALPLPLTLGAADRHLGVGLALAVGPLLVLAEAELVGHLAEQGRAQAETEAGNDGAHEHVHRGASSGDSRESPLNCSPRRPARPPPFPPGRARAGRHRACGYRPL